MLDREVFAHLRLDQAAKLIQYIGRILSGKGFGHREDKFPRLQSSHPVFRRGIQVQAGAEQSCGILGGHRIRRIKVPLPGRSGGQSRPQRRRGIRPQPLGNVAPQLRIHRVLHRDAPAKIPVERIHSAEKAQLRPKVSV